MSHSLTNTLFSLSRGVPESLRISCFFGRPFRRRIFDVREAQNAGRGGFRPILDRFWTLVWAYFRHFSRFLGGRNFDRKMIEIRGLIRRGQRQGAGLRKLILSLQTPNHAFVSEGHRKEILSRFTPRRGAANLRAKPTAAGPMCSQAFDQSEEL